MTRKGLLVSGIILNLVGLVCWLVMFLAGTDLWNEAGRPDFWELGGPYPDWRAFAYAFYLLLCVLLLNLVAHLICSAKRA